MVYGELVEVLCGVCVELFVGEGLRVGEGVAVAVGTVVTVGAMVAVGKAVGVVVRDGVEEGMGDLVGEGVGVKINVVFKEEGAGVGVLTIVVKVALSIQTWPVAPPTLNSYL